MPGAIVHEWIEPTGGAEKVLDGFVDAYPDATVYSLWDDDPDRYGRGKVVESWLAHTPLRRHKAVALPFLLPTWRSIRARAPHDWVLVSSHLFAHHVRLGNGQSPKLVYAHTPARYIWNPELDDRGGTLLAKAASRFIKPIDRRRAAEAHAIAANSEFVRSRIATAWQRDTTVIYPPVDVERISSIRDWQDTLTSHEAAILDRVGHGYLLGASRFVPYKRLDAVIGVGERLGQPVVLAGRGPDEARLRARAQNATIPVEFVISPSDALLFALYQRAAVFVFPPVEDFGIMPVEAMAAGCPVVTLEVGGAKESVEEGVSGAVAESGEIADIARAASRAMTLNRAAIPSTVARFSASRFREDVRHWIAREIGDDS